MIRILFLGDIVGEPGRSAVMRAIPVFLKERGVDFVIANAENSAAGAEAERAAGGWKASIDSRTLTTSSAAAAAWDRRWPPLSPKDVMVIPGCPSA